MYKKFLEIGKVVGTHGIRGEMKVELWSDSSQALSNIKHIYTDENGKNDIGMTSFRFQKAFMLLKIESASDPTEADSFRGKVLYVNRNEINIGKGSFLIAEIIGLDVIDGITDQNYGKVTDVIRTGANDVYIVNDGKNEYMLPAVESMIKSIDIENSKIITTPIEGIFDGKEVVDEN